MSKVEVHISKHAQKRIKKRLGLNHDAAIRKAEAAMISGIHFRRTNGLLNSYLMQLYLKYERKANNIKVLDRYIFLFNRNRLITVLHLPSEFHAIVDKLKEEKNEKHSS